MDCPVCREPMVVFELNQVEIDHCLSCRGIWFDAGELELLFEGSSEKDNLLSSLRRDEKCKEDVRKCPICLKKMEKVLVGSEEKVLIDRCKNSDGLWFDAGELNKILEAGKLDSEGPILSFLKDIFRQK
ncbi:MAG: zf-TFIIB domain-containing protein [bacterium]